MHEQRATRSSTRRTSNVSCAVRLAVTTLALAAAFALPVQAQSDTSIWGTVVHTTPAPHRIAGDRVMLYDFARKSWDGPALTDDRGNYAFYSIAPGRYLIALYIDGSPVWNKSIAFDTPPMRIDIEVSQ